MTQKTESPPEPPGYAPTPTEAALLAAALRDYASMLVLQNGLRLLPQPLIAAYWTMYGTPIDPPTLAAALRVWALRLEDVARRGTGNTPA